MALGDGSSWDESLPTNATLAVQIDDYDRDLRVGVRSRMALEHEWPTSQSATNQAGQHKFITLQNQAAKPTIAGTQLAAIYTKTVGAGLQELFWENEAGTEVQISHRAKAGASIQILPFLSTTAIANLAVIPYAGTGAVPNNTQGTQVLVGTITPTSTSSLLKVDITAQMGGASAGNCQVGLYNAIISATDAIAVGAATIHASQIVPVHFTYYVSAPSTTANTFTVRAGAPAADSDFNSSNGLTIGNLTSSIVITEIAG